MRAVLFNGFNLQSSPFTVQGTDAFDAPVRQIITQELARSDNAVDVFRRYTSRDIAINGTITSTSEAACDAAIDQLKLTLMQAGAGTLQVGWGSGYRYWGAEVKNLNIARGTNDVSRAAWSAQLHCPKFYATDGNTDTLLNSVGNTLGSFSNVITPQGTYLAYPVITITLTALGISPSTFDLSIGNPAANQLLTLTQQFATGDVITIDSLNEQIYLNSTLIPGVGAFPTFAPGQSSSLDYTDGATSRTVTINVVAPRFYL